MHRPYTVVNWFSAKISKFVATRCNILRQKCTKFDYRWDSARYPYCRTYMLASTNSKWRCWACSTWAPRSTASTATFCYSDCAQSSASQEQYSAGSRHSCKTEHSKCSTSGAHQKYFSYSLEYQSHPPVSTLAKDNWAHWIQAPLTYLQSSHNHPTFISA